MAHIDEVLFPILDPVTDYLALMALGIILAFGVVEILSKFKLIRRK